MVIYHEYLIIIFHVIKYNVIKKYVKNFMTGA